MEISLKFDYFCGKIFPREGAVDKIFLPDNSFCGAVVTLDTSTCEVAQ